MPKSHVDEIVQHYTAKLNGVRLHYVEAPNDGPLVVLLHGFPDFWFGWRRQIPALHAAGFRIIAPDLRGYNLSGKPRGIHAYSLDRLSGDVAALIAHLGGEKAHLVGHDWGGVIAWHTAIRRPRVVDRLAILNAPHPATYARELKNWDQLRRSWYILFFQLPWLPERLIAANDFAVLRAVWRLDPKRRGAWTKRDLERSAQAMARSGSLTAALNYYRAFVQRPKYFRVANRRVVQPTLVLWGEGDRYLSLRHLDALEEWVPNLQIERFDASHWLQHDAEKEVNSHLIEFFARK